MKTYLRYEARSPPIGVVASSRAPVALVSSAPLRVVVPAWDAAVLWEFARGLVLARYEPRKGKQDGEVTALAASAELVALGRFSGRVDVYREGGAPRASFALHKSAVVCARFSADGARVAVGSLDTTATVIDCIADTVLWTLSSHRDQVSDVLFLSPRDVVTCSKDTLVKVWDCDQQICVQTLALHSTAVWALDAHPDGETIAVGSSDGLLQLLRKGDDGLWAAMPGPVARQSSERVEMLRFVDASTLVVQSAGRSLEVYAVRAADEAARKTRRRLKRLRERGKEATAEDECSWAHDVLELTAHVRLAHRVRSFAWASPMSVVLAYSGINLVEEYALDEGKLAIKTSPFQTMGHRAEPRALAMTADDALVLSCGEGACKVWNVATGLCVRTMQTGTALCVVVLAGDALCAVGTHQGAIHVLALATGLAVQTHADAHAGAVLAMDCKGDSVASGGADKCVKFWRLSAKGLAHARTLKLGEDVLAVRFSRHAQKDKTLVAVALLDSTVKVFHEDSLEFALSLYGHKLPVLCMDASDDNVLLATGASDKNIKVWGLDFGDCHRSIFAHDGSVTSVRFVPRTHYLLSCGRDGRVRYWDMDSFERILSFDSAHWGDAWAVVPSSDGARFVSCGRDRALRVWERTRDLVFLDEERANELARAVDDAAGAGGAAEAAEHEDTLVTAIDECAGDGAELARKMRAMRPAELEDALTLLPFALVAPLLSALADALELRVEAELCAKAAMRLVRMHAAPLSTSVAKQELARLKQALCDALGEQARLMGINAAGLKRLKRKVGDS